MHEVYISVGRTKTCTHYHIGLIGTCKPWPKKIMQTTPKEADATVMAMTFAKTIARIAEFAVDLAESLHSDLGLEYTGPSSTRKSQKKRSRSEKDPNEPKRPQSAYMIYSAFVREESKGKGEALPQVKEIAEMWNKLDEQEKEKFNRDAQIQKDAYDRQMAEYKKVSNSTGSNIDNKSEPSHGSDSEADDVPPPKVNRA